MTGLPILLYLHFLDLLLIGSLAIFNFHQESEVFLRPQLARKAQIALLDRASVNLDR